MNQLQFAATYDGREATAHVIDMQRFGKALVGLDRMVTVGIIGLTERRIPRGRLGVKVFLTVSEPRKGCVGVVGAAVAIHQGSQVTFPWIIEQIKQFGFEFVLEYLTAAFMVLGGRKKDAEPHIDTLIDAMVKMNESQLDDRQKERQEIYADRKREREFIIQLIESVRPSARDVVGPLGGTASSLYLGRKFDERLVEIDEPMAEAVRSKDAIDIGDVEQIQVRIDGLTKHSSRGSIERLDEPGRFIPVEIRDPRFAMPDNPYFNAFQSGEPLVISARAALREGVIVRLYVMDTPT